MMNKEQKKNYITEMTANFENSEAVLVTHYQGLTVKQLDELINSMLNYLNLYKDKKDFEIPEYKFIEEKIHVEDIDYYHSNSIARASKTMAECKNSLKNIKKTGTYG